MLEKGIILEVKAKYAIAMLPGGEMVRIQYKPGLQIGDRIYILPEDYYEESAAEPVHTVQSAHGGIRPMVKRIAALAAMLALMLGLMLHPWAQPVYAVASFDGAQNIQLELDQNLRILNGYSYEAQDHQVALDSLKGKKLSDVRVQLLDLMGEGPVLIGYAPEQENADFDLAVEQLLRELFSGNVVLYLSGNGEDIALSEAAKTSIGVYLAQEVVHPEQREALDEFLDSFGESLEDLEDLYEELGDDADLSGLSALDFEQMLAEIAQNPDYDGDDDVLEILADKLEELHDEHKEENWDTEDDEDETEADDDDDDDADVDNSDDD